MPRTQRIAGLALAAACAGCVTSPPSGSDNPQGGASGVAGAQVASGGSGAGVGGARAAGGAPGSGGATDAGSLVDAGADRGDGAAVGTGGRTGAGGAPSAGGRTGAGGATGAGGSTGTGGSAGTGGAPGSGVLAATPPMGWNSWNKFQGMVNDMVIRQIADALVSSGMAGAGYQYLVIDDTWQAGRDASGSLLSDTTGSPPRFPNMKALADYVHGKGLKFGIYSDRGTLTCAGRPGSYGFETRDAQTFASWGVDYLKYDNCSPATGRTDDASTQQDFTVMRDALRATGRPIVYSISAWWFFPWEATVGNLWRTTTDIQDNWASVTALLDRNGGDTTRYGNCTSCAAAMAGTCVTCTAALPEAAYGAPGISSYAGPGRWNDPDMLEVGNGGMTDTEYRSHFSLWAMMAAPLIAGNDVRSMSDATRTILLNSDVIAVDQDPMGRQGRPISTSTSAEVWSKQLAGTNTYAVALFNRGSAPATIAVTWPSLGIPAGTTVSVRDLWTHTNLGNMATQYSASVPSHGVVMLRVAPP